MRSKKTEKKVFDEARGSGAATTRQHRPGTKSDHRAPLRYPKWVHRNDNEQLLRKKKEGKTIPSPLKVKICTFRPQKNCKWPRYLAKIKKKGHTSS